MKMFFLVIAFVCLAGLAQAQSGAAKASETVKIEAGKGFAYPFYLYLPAALREEPARNRVHSLLVIPNNTGAGDDDLAVHEQSVKQKMLQVGFVFGRLEVPVLMPVFPRPKTDWKIYTHALDRDSLLTDKAAYKRFDLQLVAMVAAAREKLAQENVKTDAQVLLYGYSAAGMFSNRFAFLHPDKVKAVASGSPGGWPLAPGEKVNSKTLRYPVGVSDIETLTGAKFDLDALQKIPFFIFMGDKDDNDSVVFGDGYDEEDKNLVFELFGKTPLERWAASQKLYRDAKVPAEFKLYPDTAHKVTPAMLADVLAFLEKNKKAS
jgi:predicted esterase